VRGCYHQKIMGRAKGTVGSGAGKVSVTPNSFDVVFGRRRGRALRPFFTPDVREATWAHLRAKRALDLANGDFGRSLIDTHAANLLFPLAVEWAEELDRTRDVQGNIPYRSILNRNYPTDLADEVIRLSEARANWSPLKPNQKRTFKRYVNSAVERECARLQAERTESLLRELLADAPMTQQQVAFNDPNSFHEAVILELAAARGHEAPTSSIGYNTGRSLVFTEREFRSVDGGEWKFATRDDAKDRQVYRDRNAVLYLVRHTSADVYAWSLDDFVDDLPESGWPTPAAV